MSRPGRNNFDQYCRGIDKRLASFDTVNFILLQEVDISSRRSYNVDQQEIVNRLLPSHASLFAINYNVQFVPLPLYDPMGGVLSGLQFLGNQKLLSASWRPFEEDRSWPLGLFKPDRCYQFVEAEVKNYRRLYVFNTHNSAFDDGSQRESQIKMLYSEMLKAYQLGHYVIAGGDWNLNPIGWAGDQYISGDIPFLLEQQPLESPGPGWQLVFDPGFPTNRDVSSPYKHGVSPCTIIDFFVCSPNVKVKEIKTLYNAFQYSDHQPVYICFELLP
jgi:endonuclease/exonuclease/phosphatase family metal-dependent hydrolase